ncbi:MAG: hypothetical protein MPJ78_17715 [Hyphomicrobiaceae bacterium]|nr:hypothetical protein [Hyphomicrobiaceae bacterium]
MPEALILVVLTATSAGGVSAAFVNHLNAPGCKEKGELVRSILESQNVEILRLGCFKGSEKFEKFNHGAAADAPRYAYRLTLSGNHVIVDPVKDVTSCKKGATSALIKKPDKQHCVTSTQKMLRKAQG